MTQTFDENNRLDLYHSILMDYAAGRLDEAYNLIIAAHISMSAKARRLMHGYESLGGYMLEQECTPVSMCESALNQVLGKLDVSAPLPKDSFKYNSAPDMLEGLPDIPETLKSCLHNQKQKPRWRFIALGFKTYCISLDCDKADIRFLRVKPGRTTPSHTHGGLEVTLVLEGAYEDESGRYGRGDLIICDETHQHKPKSCPDQGCTCLIVSDTPMKPAGLAGLLNVLFLR